MAMNFGFQPQDAAPCSYEISDINVLYQLSNHGNNQRKGFKHFIQTHFGIPRCTKNENIGGEFEICKCGLFSSSHDISQSSASTTSIGLNACSRLTFPSSRNLYSHRAEYLRVSNKCSKDKICKMLRYHAQWDVFMENQFSDKVKHFIELPDIDSVSVIQFWREVLSKPIEMDPAIILSVIGSGRVPKDFKEPVFWNEILTTIRATNGWILTDGLRHGVTHLVEEAVGLCTTRMDPIRCFGIAPWSCVKHNGFILEQGISYDGCAQYPTHKYSGDKENVNNQFLLATNHARFILTDCGNNDAQTAFATNCQFRADFEKFMASTGVCEPAICVVRLLIGGTENHIDEVLMGLKNKIKLMVCRNSGGLADLILDLKRDAQEKDHNSVEEDVITQKSVQYNLIVTQSQITTIVSILNSEFTSLIMECDYVNKMDMASQLFSLLSQNHERFELRFATLIKYNQINLAKELLMNQGNPNLTQQPFLKNLVLLALAYDKLDLFKMLIDVGCNIDHGLIGSSRNAEFDLFDEMFKMKQFRHLRRLYPKTERLDDDQTRWQHLRIAIYGTQFGFLDKTDTRMVLDKHLHRLFIWAVVFNRKSEIFYFWQQLERPIAGAIIASMICQRMIDMKYMRYLGEQSDRYRSTKKKFDQYAVDLINNAYTKNQNMTLVLLNKPDRQFGGMNLITLAATARNKAFLATTACQRVILQKWRNGFDVHGPLTLLCAVFVIPILHLNRYVVPGATEFCKICEGLTGCRCEKMIGDGEIEAFKSIEREERRRIYTPQQLTNLTNLLASKVDDDVIDDEDEDQTIIGNTFRQTITTWCMKIGLFYSAPMVKTLLALVLYIIFCILYAYVVLFSFRWHFTPWECFLYAVMCGMFAGHARNIFDLPGQNVGQKFHNWWSYPGDTFKWWNRYHALVLCVAVLSFIQRLFATTFEWSRLLLVINLVVHMVGIFKYYVASEYLGPKLVMIKKMTVHAIVYIAIFGVLFASYTIATQALQNPRRDFTWNVFSALFHQGIWGAFGDLNENARAGTYVQSCNETEAFNEIECTSSLWLIPIMLVAYLFFGTIMLTNMLIATFTNTFDDVQSRAEQIYRYQKYWITEEYSKHNVAFLPFFNVIDSIVAGLRFIFTRPCKPTKLDTNQLIALRERMLGEGTVFSIFEMQCRDDYVCENDQCF